MTIYLKKLFLLFNNDFIITLVSLNKSKFNIPRIINKQDKIITTYSKIPNIKNLLKKLDHDFDWYFGESNVVKETDFVVSKAIETSKVKKDSGALISTEDVDVWSNNGAISEARREAIRQMYAQASQEFSDLHSVELAEGRIVDQMLFGIAIGRKSH